jgi:hypothetical protein
LSPLLPTHAVALPRYISTAEADVADKFTAVVVGAGAPVTVRATQSGYIEYLTGCRVKLVTSATVASRLMRLELQDELTNAVQTIASPFAQAASTTVDYVWSANVTAAFGVSGSVANMPTFSLPMLPNFRVRLTMDNIQLGDTWSNLYFAVTQYPTSYRVGVEDSEAVLYSPPIPLDL